ncbi:hypothetical protein [Microlunatus antarcticus]|uniref:SEFIR domain-containing protein n=1 Tax=Microlunatus antarcticus TaxID=53388 RepID=A0A7W5P8M1_9ACTN|nr:hypothetical protein [Microlunatus antarcticus]MBB3328804.1 hypothetical protein [Microlunatus antarcticus]
MSVPPTALLSWAHKPNQPGTDAAWSNEVLQLAVNLRQFGVDADLDLFHLSEPGIEWTGWGPSRITKCDYTVVLVNQAWRQRFEGTNEPNEGAGAVAEADTLLGLFERNQDDFRRRLLVVVLPGADLHDVPPRLSGQQRFVLKDLTRNDLEPLLRLLHGSPEHVMQPVGPAPFLPPVRFGPIDGAAGTPGIHTYVPGVPDEGQEVVQQQLASNPAGAVVRSFLEELTTKQGVALHGVRRRDAAPGSLDDYTGYLRLTRAARTIGYLYASTGRLNPKVSGPTLETLSSLAPDARQVGSSNEAYRAVITVNDPRSREQAIALLRRAAGLGAAT